MFKKKKTGESNPLARNENLVMSGGNEQRSVCTGCLEAGGRNPAGNSFTPLWFESQIQLQF